jgi:hypothetical protein
MYDAIRKKWEGKTKGPISNVRATTLEFFDDSELVGQYVLPGGKALNEAINANSRLTELIDAFGIMSDLTAELEKRRAVSPNWEAGLKMFIEELNSYLTEKDEDFLPGHEIDAIQIRSFTDLTAGKDMEIIQYDFWLCDYLGIKFRPELLYNLAKGTALAIFLPSLQKELNELTGIENDRSELPQIHEMVKLKWEGQKNQLYSVLSQLKDKDLIKNTYNELADFLKNHVLGFQVTAKETIEKELKKNYDLPENLAKNKRINLDLDQES